MNKLFLIGVVLVLLTVFCGGAFGASWGTLNVTPSRASQITDVNAVVTYTGTDLNAVCFNTTDSNSGVSCYSTEATTPITIPLTASLFSSSEGENTIYAFLKQDDGNYSTSQNADFNIDTTAPVLTSTLTSTPTIVDGNLYTTTSFATVTVTISETDLDGAKVVIDGTTTYYTASPGNLGNKTFYAGAHTITIDANDDLGNLSTQESFTFTVDTNVPVLADANSANRTVWTNDEEPDFVINATDGGSAMTSGTAAFSCSSTGTFQEIAFTSTTITTFNITATAYDCNTADGNTLVYVKVKDAAGNWSNVVSTNVLYDNTNPSAPSGLGAVGNDGAVYISWTATGTADNMSGNAGYQIFVNDTLNSTTTDVSKTISGLTNGTTYSFKIRTYDNAGNVSSFTSTASAAPAATGTGTGTDTSDLTSEATVKRDGSAVDYVKSGDEIEIFCSYSAEVDGAKIYYKYYTPNTSQELLRGPTNDISLFSETLTVSGSSERLGAWCYGSTDSDSATSPVNYVYLDNDDPTISLENGTTSFSGTVKLEATASDTQQLSKVEFEINNIKYGTTQDGNSYSYNLDTTDLPNGNYTLKAIATDGAGNKKEVTKSVTIANTTTPEQEKELAMKDATTKKKIVEDLIKYLEGEGVLISGEIKDKKKVADQLLEDANGLTDLDAVKAKATEALAKYDEINSELPSGFEVVSGSMQNYEYSLDDVVNILMSFGIDQASAEAAKATLEKTNAKRTIELIKVGDSYQAKIKVTLVNDTESTIVKIIEIVPKDFAASASLLHSSHPFVVIEEDPIIEFTIDVPIGSEIEISYGIGNLTEEEANSVLDNNIIASFAAPPIVTGNDTAISGALGSGNGFGFILMIIIIIIVVLVVMGGGAFVYMQYNKDSTPTFGTKSNGIGSKIKNKIKKDNSGNNPNKWKYKG